VDERKAKLNKILKKASTVILAARAFGEGVSTAQRKRNNTDFYDNTRETAREGSGFSNINSTGKRQRIGHKTIQLHGFPSPISNDILPSLGTIGEASRAQAQLLRALNPTQRSTVSVTDAKLPLSLPPPPSNPAQKPQ
jgi:hypothetical protein